MQLEGHKAWKTVKIALPICPYDSVRYSVQSPTSIIKCPEKNLRTIVATSSKLQTSTCWDSKFLRSGFAVLILKTWTQVFAAFFVFRFWEDHVLASCNINLWRYSARSQANGPDKSGSRSLQVKICHMKEIIRSFHSELIWFSLCEKCTRLVHGITLGKIKWARCASPLSRQWLCSKPPCRCDSKCL